MALQGQFLKKTDTLYTELNERVEAATSSYSATGEFLQYIYSVLVAKNHQKIRSRCLVHEFSFTYIFFNSIYEKVRRTMRTAIVSYLLKYFYSFSAAELNNIEINNNKLLLRDFYAMRVIIEIAMMKILNNCISGRLKLFSFK